MPNYSMIGIYYHDSGTPINPPTCQNKEINPCKFVTVGVLIINHGNMSLSYYNQPIAIFKILKP